MSTRWDKNRNLLLCLNAVLEYLVSTGILQTSGNNYDFNTCVEGHLLKWLFDTVYNAFNS